MNGILMELQLPKFVAKQDVPREVMKNLPIVVALSAQNYCTDCAGRLRGTKTFRNCLQMW